MLIGAAAVAAPTIGAAEGQDWRFALTPYLWLPNIDGTAEFDTPPDGDGRPDAEAGPNSYLEHLQFALMLAGEARKGDWAVRADVVYVDFGDERAAVRSVTGPGGVVEIPINTGTTLSLDGLEWQLTLGYTAIRKSSVTLELLGGVRYLDVSVALDWEFDGPLDLLPQSGTFSQDAELWDAIIGTRGRVTFGDGRWFVPFHVDVGTGSSALTWQVLGGLGYGFSWGDVLAAYRHLEYDQEEGDLLQSVRFSGPAVGVTFRF